ncbi:probable cysteine--tRNA ligase, mitochondrial isoform X4 [Alligator sinensis]|uniref:Probable cysteine--tRNA ligase, mitochondrial isoform X4 n=1 Tax=Alligator sinensis TaxID=38654 RepID=A0A3Q0FX84_ALLSI|nr:probable cysteine--tRNA ligase, mitochondrial isoform X4 [Alligator sinensis]
MSLDQHGHNLPSCHSSYVRFDIIRRILTKFFGNEVIMVMGITDIDDKIIKRANEMNISPPALARIYEEDFKQDMAALKVLPPTIYMRVTENIPQIIYFIEQIIANGHAYATSKGNVYFDVRSWGNKYGKLTSTYPNAQEETADTDKQHVQDFALWKAAKPQEIFWASPWGKGRPGWHIECSTISSTVFGNQLDIHTGGIDLAFPHHENEIAQCEAYHQCEQWCNYFLHSATEFSDESMDDAKNLLWAISSFINDANTYIKGQLVCEPIREDVLWERLANTKVNVKAAFADDFDTSRAVSAIMDLIHHGNRQLKAVTKEVGSPRSPIVYAAIISYIENLFNTVGISLGERQVISEDRTPVMFSGVIDELVNFRIKVRNYARAMPEATEVESTVQSQEAKLEEKEKRRLLLLEREPLLQACDNLRRDLAAFGINIKDRGATSTWEAVDQRREQQRTERER